MVSGRGTLGAGAVGACDEGFVAEAFVRLSSADRRVSVVPGVVHVRPDGLASGLDGTTSLVLKSRLTF